MGSGNSKNEISRYIDKSIPYEPLQEMRSSTDGWLYSVINKKSNQKEIAKLIKVTKKNQSNIDKFITTIKLLSNPNNINLVTYYNVISVPKKMVMISMTHFSTSLLLINPLEILTDSTLNTAINNICEGINRIHSQNYIHGSIKPSNIFQNSDNIWLLSDYCEYYVTDVTSHQNIKDYQYLSPEVLKSLNYDKSSDIWSLGCVIYYILTGNEAFRSGSIPEITQFITYGKYPSVTNLKNNNHISFYENLISQLIVVDQKQRLKINDIISIINSTNLIYMSYEYIIKQLDNNKKITDLKEIESIYNNADMLNKIIEEYSRTKNINYLSLLGQIRFMYYDKLNQYLHDSINTEGEDANIIDLWDYGFSDKNKFTLSHGSDLECNERVLVYIQGVLSSQMNLEILDLGEAYLDDKCIDTFAYCLKTLPNLKYISLNGNDVSDKGIKMLLSSFSTTTKLEELLLSHNRISDKGFKAISDSFKYIKSLKIFDISYNEVGDEGLKYMSWSLAQLSNLQKFIINNNKFTNAGCAVLIDGLCVISTLTDLNISHTKIDDEGVLKISDVISKLKNLRFLDLSFTEATHLSIDKILNQITCITELANLEVEYFTYPSIKSKLNSNLPISSQADFIKLTDSSQFIQEVIEDYNMICKSSYFYFLTAIAAYRYTQYYTTIKSQISLDKDSLEEKIFDAIEEGKLILSEKNITDNDMDKINDFLQFYFEFVVIDFGYNKISNITPIALSFQNINTICELCLSCNPLKDDGIKILSENLQYLPQLQYLYLRKVEMTSVGFHYLSEAFQFLLYLSLLNIGDNKIGDESVEKLCRSLNGFSHLCSLTICSINMTDCGAKLLSKSLRDITRLVELNIAYNDIRDDGIKAISDNFQFISKLKELYLNHTEISDIGLQDLCQNIKELPVLTVLTLDHNLLTEDGIEYLLSAFDHIPLLTELHLEGNLFEKGDENVNKLYNSNPRCKISL